MTAKDIVYVLAIISLLASLLLMGEKENVLHEKYKKELIKSKYKEDSLMGVIKANEAIFNDYMSQTKIKLDSVKHSNDSLKVIQSMYRKVTPIQSDDTLSNVLKSLLDSICIDC